jgi:hypothetical protein
MEYLHAPRLNEHREDSTSICLPDASESDAGMHVRPDFPANFVEEKLAEPGHIDPALITERPGAGGHGPVNPEPELRFALARTTTTRRDRPDHHEPRKRGVQVCPGDFWNALMSLSFGGPLILPEPRTRSFRSPTNVTDGRSQRARAGSGRSGSDVD